MVNPWLLEPHEYTWVTHTTIATIVSTMQKSKIQPLSNYSSKRLAECLDYISKQNFEHLPSAGTLHTLLVETLCWNMFVFTTRNVTNHPDHSLDAPYLRTPSD